MIRIADAPDAIARLRRFILDLAVRGKLVPQDAADEPASGFAEADREGEGAVGEGRRDQEMEGASSEVEEPPFDLPRNWRWTPIREVCEVIGGRKIPQSTFHLIFDVTAIGQRGRRLSL